MVGVSILRAAIVAMSVVATGAAFSGRALSASVAASPTTVDADLTIFTVPPLPDAVFRFDGVTYTAGAGGVVLIPDAGDLRDVSTRLTFDRYDGGPDVEVVFTQFAGMGNVNRTRTLQAVFDTSRAVSFSFIDLNGRAVDVDRVTSMTLKSSLGVVFEFDSQALRSDAMLPASRSLQSREGYISKDLYYTVQDLVIDGTNTVNRSQQKFIPSETRAVEVETQFYNVTVASADALFGFTTGSAVLVRWPDGRETRHEPIDDMVRLYLPRGTYDMRVDGSGLALWRPVAVSRDQDIELELLSTLDVVAALGVVVAIATGLILMGRRRRRTWRASESAAHEAARDDAGAGATDTHEWDPRVDGAERDQQADQAKAVRP